VIELSFLPPTLIAQLFPILLSLHVVPFKFSQQALILNVYDFEFCDAESKNQPARPAEKHFFQPPFLY